ncbi:MAG: PHP domain-containing protein [Ignavibacteriaceae bacterium]
MPDKSEIIKLLTSIANLLEFHGENRFEVSAFRNGANVLRGLEKDINELVQQKSLNSIKGIGKGLQSVIYDFYEKNKSEKYEELKNKTPEGIEEILRIRGLGPKKLRVLYDELNITNIGELEYACKENHLALLKGFGNKTQVNIQEQIDKLKIYSKFVLINKAEEIYNEIAKVLSKLKHVKRFEATGELRRHLEIISSLEIVLLTPNINKFKSELEKEVKFDDENGKLELSTGFAISCLLHIVTTEIEYISKLFETTGSKEFLKKIKFNLEKNKSDSEEEIFKKINTPFIIPEMREELYFDQKKKKLQENSNLSMESFNGLLHFHTTYSDGRNSLEDMIKKVKEMGMEYAAVCDHSKSAFYANGLNEDMVLRQKEEVAKVFGEIGIKVFHGIESDILQDGSLDYDDNFLGYFDFLVASVHSGFTLKEDAMTGRIINAIENLNTDVLGHPSGRLLLSREPYRFDHKKIIDACAVNKVAIEINANPRRLDLDWRWIYYAREKGCLFTINADAHSTNDFLYTEYGVKIARKGGLKEEEVINCYDLNSFKRFLQRKVKRVL